MTVRLVVKRTDGPEEEDPEKFEYFDMGKGLGYQRKSNAEIKEIALRMYKGEIFCSMQLRPHEWDMILMVFMPLIFFDPFIIKQWIEDEIYHLYAEMKDCAPRSVNGLPCFFSCAPLSREDSERVARKYQQILEAMEALGDGDEADV